MAQKSRAAQVTGLAAALHHEPTETLQGRSVVRGLEELEVMMKVVKARFLRNCVFCIVVAVLWPLLLPLGIIMAPCIYCVRNSKGVQEYVLVAVGVALLSMLWIGAPLFLVSMSGGLQHFVLMIDAGQIGWVELVEHLGSFVFVLIFLVYAWVVHESVSLEVVCSLQARTRYLKNHWTLNLVLTRPEQQELMGKEGPVGIVDLIGKLETYPGWKSSFDDLGGGDLEEAMSARRIQTETTPLVTASVRMSHLDSVVLSSDKLCAPTADEFGAFKMKVWSLLHSLVKGLGYGQFFGCIVLATGRAIIPRLWVHFYLGGHFLPAHPIEAMVVIMSLLCTLVSGALWLLVLAAVCSQYAHNVSQMLLVSAVVDPRSRHEYMRSLNSGQPEMGLPMLDLSFSANTKIWWAIREYAIVDSLDERTDLEVVLGVALVYQGVIIIYCIFDLVLKGRATASLCIALFDLVVVGSIVSLSMLHCVQVNAMLRSHAAIFLRARHSVFTDIKVDTVRQELPSPSAEERKHVLRLHSHLVDKTRHADTLQKLFGLEVTANSVMQFLCALGCGVGSATMGIMRAHKDAAAAAAL